MRLVQLKLGVLLWLAVSAPVQADTVYRWEFTAEHIKDGQVKPLTGALPGKIVGPVAFSDAAPKALILPGDSKSKQCIEISADLATAKLPMAAIAVEAWVWIDRVQDWGGIVGAFQDNGPYEKGWLLGYEKSRFFFAVASKGRKTLTYLHASSPFQTSCWYHLVGTYDGKEQRIYIDGELQGKSTEQRGNIDYPPKGWSTVGAYRDNDEFYSMAGRIESVAVHDRGLLADEVKKEFAARKARFPGIEGTRPVVNDWPTYNRDNRRSGLSEEELKFPLQEAWSYRAATPQPAWPDEAKADYYHNKFEIAERVVFDRADHIVGVGDRIYFGSSAEGAVFCLDAITGNNVWSFPTEGPVRLAPTIAGDRVLFGSDDGHVYCLRSKDGSLVWKKRIAAEDRRIPGNGRMISAWPIRTGVLVEDGKAHTCAGVFPTWGVYQVSLNVEDGKELSRQTLKITAQGYLERAFGKLMISAGRDPASAFVADLKQGGKELGKEVNTLSKDYPFAFVGAGEIRIAGGDGKIAAFKKDTGEKIWSASVEGKVYSLAVVRGRLFASTDAGNVYCFAPKTPENLVERTLPQQRGHEKILGMNRDVSAFEIAIAKAAGDLDRGYILLIGVDNRRDLISLSTRYPHCQIVVLEPDDAKADALRRSILDYPLMRMISVQHGPIDRLPFSDYSFNLVVNGAKSPRAEVLRVAKPHGGVAIFDRGGMAIERRGMLEGEGEWTHMYGDTGNTSCSNDKLVGNELQLQWFGKPGPRGMIDRHHRTVPPVSKDGRIFVPGEDHITAVDIYNGTILWEKDIPGSRRVTAFRDSSYLALAENAIYIAAADRCLALNPQTGKELRVFRVPELSAGRKYEWGFTATVGDLLLGSAVQEGGVRREQNHKATTTTTHWDFVPAVGSDALFAYERATGKLAWTYRAAKGLIVNPSIAVGDGRMYFIESDNVETLKNARAKYADLVGKGSILRCLDLKTGSIIWSQPGTSFTPIQHNVFSVLAQGRLAVVGSRNSGSNKAKDTLWYDIHVFDSKTGDLLWTKSQNQLDKINGEHGEQERHPTVVGSTLFCEPFAYDLLTGKPVDWKWPWAGGKTRRGCGTFSASATCLFYRDDTAKTFDLAAGTPKALTAETRPGCWINFLPVGGMVVAPEASSGCTCNYSVQTSLGLIPVKK